MTEAIIIAIIGFLGAVLGSGLGVIASAKLTNYRLEQLEKKVNLHNNVIERMYKLEQREALLEQHVSDLHKFHLQNLNPIYRNLLQSAQFYYACDLY